MQSIHFVLCAICLAGWTTTGFSKDPSNSATSSTTKVDYTIQEFNKSGSFTVGVGFGPSKNNKVSGYIRITDEKGNILQELTPKMLTDQLANIDRLANGLVGNPDIAPKIKKGRTDKKMSLAAIRASLTGLKETLESEVKMRKLIDKLKDMPKANGSGLSWSYILSTVRNQTATVTGCLDCN